MRSFRLTLAYDGTCFFGSQRQPAKRTVQGELEQSLTRLGAGPVRSTFAGRTDRGVHAAGQVAVVHLTTWRATSSDLLRALNARLPRDVAVIRVNECNPAFNPRFDAIWREYRYFVSWGGADPILRRYAWMLRENIDVDRTASAADLLLGKHDFASFAGGGEGVPWSERASRKHGTTRTVFRCSCMEAGAASIPWCPSNITSIEIRIAADGFLPRMVRNIVGALVEVGQGRREPEWISNLVEARDRRSGARTAPPEGLVFWQVGFAGDAIES